MDKVFVAHDLGQFACDGAVDVFNDVEIGGEEDIKVSLVDLLSLAGKCLQASKREDHTKGVDTGTVRRLYRVCTTGAFNPGTASGRTLKSLATNRCAGK